MERGQPAYNKIRNEFGPEVFTAGGDLNRAALGDIIFESPEKRAKLNEITHPAIHKKMYKAVMMYFLQGHNFIAMELPLLFESGNYLYRILANSIPHQYHCNGFFQVL